MEYQADSHLASQEIPNFDVPKSFYKNLPLAHIQRHTRLVS